MLKKRPRGLRFTNENISNKEGSRAAKKHENKREEVSEERKERVRRDASFTSS